MPAPQPAAAPSSHAVGEPGDLSADDFARVARLLHTLTGIHLPEGKENLVRARLAARVRALALPSYGAYVDLLARDPSGAEMELAIDLLSNNKTAFFREARHFELLGEELRRAVPRKLRIWSAACSTGEEPYSIAMTLTAAGAVLPYCDARVLATDICRRALATARDATYAPVGLGDVPGDYARRYFEPGGRPGSLTVTPAVRALVAFARLNLMEPWPMKGPFDIIFCRNVMIYFDHATQERLVERMRGLLAPGGLLLIGHAESLSALRHQYAYVAPATYRK